MLSDGGDVQHLLISQSLGESFVKFILLEARNKADERT